MDYQHKNDQIKSAKGLCRKTGFLHFNNSSFVPSCEWIYFFKVKNLLKSLNNEINHYFIFKELMTIPFHHLTGQSIGQARTRFFFALLCLSGTFGLGGTWGLLEGVECLGCENPSTSTKTPFTLTLVGERLKMMNHLSRPRFLRDLLNP